MFSNPKKYLDLEAAHLLSKHKTMSGESGKNYALVL
jgi:hypothetical protein